MYQVETEQESDKRYNTAYNAACDERGICPLRWRHFRRWLLQVVNHLLIRLEG